MFRLVAYPMIVKYYLSMATFAQIKEIRLQINDPAGFINIVEGTPSTAPQTAYLDGGVYKDGDGTTLMLEVSDARLGSWYDSYGHTGAVVRAIKQIIANIAARLPIVKSDSGAESTEYTSLTDLYKFYRALLDDAENEDEKTEGTSTGRIYTAQSVEVAGGNI